MDYESKLSEMVQDYIYSLDREQNFDLPPAEQEEATRWNKMIKLMVDDIISSREAFGDKKLAVIESLVKSNPELIKDFLDDRFTRDVIDAVSGYVGRTMQLSRLEGSQLPSQVTNSYVREAGRTYILGLPQACVALCRAALEQALKEGIGYQATGTFVEMNDLLDEAESAFVVDGPMRKLARKVADEADNVLHEKPTNLAKAYEVLVMLRGVLQHVYA